MFVTDLRQQFYNPLVGKRIIVIVNYDIDAICACKILQSLFKYEHVVYTVVPTMGLKGMERAFKEHENDAKFFLLINCGGCIDIVELLQPQDDVTFFICDSHRPWDVCNIYSDRQVCLLGDPNSEENIPAFESLFCDSDAESNDEDDENEANDSGAGESDAESESVSDEQPAQKLSRMEKFERKVLKQRQQRAWEQTRDRLLFEYTQYSYYGRSSAVTIFDLAWKLSKDDMDLLWWAIVGITEQLILGKIESSFYTLEIENLQSHVSRLTNKTNDQSNLSAAKINFENDLHLALYRHWSVLDSIRHSMYPACKMKLWTLRGEKKLNEMLVEMGLPLMQAKQKFNFMDLELRQEFFTKIEKLSEKYGIPDIVHGSFTLSYGYSNRYSSTDYVYALLAILESVKKDQIPEDCFLEAMDSLSRNNNDILIVGIENAKFLLTTISTQVQTSLDSFQVRSTGSFYYFFLHEEQPFFTHPYGFLLLAKFILHGYVALSRNRKAPQLPLIAVSLVDVESGQCMLVGVAPVREDSPKNFFGKAFERAASKCNANILQDFFETSLIQIRQIHLTKFLDALTVLLG